MTSARAMKRLMGSLVFVSAVGWASLAQAQLGVGTTWVRTDLQGVGITMSVEACCNGGLRLVYHVPSMGGQPPVVMTVDSPMNGAEVPALIGGKPSGETMAITRVDAHHYKAIAKMSDMRATYDATVSADDKTLTIEGVTQVGGTTQKITEAWVRK